MENIKICWKNETFFTQDNLIDIDIFKNVFINIDNYINIFKIFLIDIDIFRIVLIDIDIFQNGLININIDINIFKTFLIDIYISMTISSKSINISIIDLSLRPSRGVQYINNIDISHTLTGYGLGVDSIYRVHKNTITQQTP